jgi:hypothetical protein
MAVVALILFGVYFGIAFVARTVLQLRRTGDHGLSGRPGCARLWWLRLSGCRGWDQPGPVRSSTRHDPSCLGDARLVKRAPDDRSGWVCGDRQMLHDLRCRDDATMTDLEPWFPWSELDLRPPH